MNSIGWQWLPRRLQISARFPVKLNAALKTMRTISKAPSYLKLTPQDFSLYWVLELADRRYLKTDGYKWVKEQGWM